MEKLTKKDNLTERAAQHFDLDINEVEPKHIQFIIDQDFALNWGYIGTPLLSYTVDESGVVEFDKRSQDTLVDQWDHRFGSN